MWMCPATPAPRCLTDIHPEINAVGAIERAQDRFHPLSQSHHFVGGVCGEFVQFVQMGIRHNHDVAIRVWVGIENDVAILAAVDDSRLLVAFFRQVAEDAARLLLGASNISVTPRSPEMIHAGRVAEITGEPRATS